MAKQTRHQWHAVEESETVVERPPSRSEKKRQASRVTQLGIRLTQLPPKVLARLELHEELREAIALCRVMKRGNAQAQQIRLIGKLLRMHGTDELVAAVEQLTSDVHEKAAIAKVRADQRVGRTPSKPR